MPTWIKRLLASPVFKGAEDKTRTAWLLNIILWLLLARALLFRGITWVEETAQAPRLSLFVPLTLLLIGMMLLLRRGYVRLASIGTVLGFWLSLTAIAVINGGVRSTGFRNYIIPVLIAGLLLGRGAALAVAGLSILAGLGMWQAESNGWLPAPLIPVGSFELLVTHAISLLLAAVLVTLATRSIEEALGRARQEIVERRQAEEAVRQSESRWQAIFNNAAIGIALVDADGYPVQSNAALQRMLGYSGEELRRMPFVQFTHPDDAAVDFALAQELFAGQRDHYQIEKRYLKKDGQMRWGNMTASSLSDGNNSSQFAIGMVEDITERKLAEQALQHAEELFRAIVEDQTEMIVRWKPDGTRTFVNQAYCRTFGKSFDELVGSSFLPLVAEPYRETVREKIRSITPATPVALGVHESLLPDGTTCWQEWADRGLFDQQGRLIELQSVGRDITERKLAEEALRASEERFFKAFNHSPLRMGIIRIKDGVVLDANDCWFREMGFTREEIIGQPAYELKRWIGKEDSRIQQLLKEGQPFRNLEFRPHTKADEERIVLTSAEVIEISGEPCFLMVTNDITELKRAEDAVHESEERFRQLTENIREVFWLNTPDLSESLYISPAYESIWGRTRESLRQNPRSFLEAIHPEDRPKVIAVFGQKLERAFEMEYRVVRPDGSIRWIWDRGFPIQDATGQVYRITGIAEDITDHKRAEEQLRATSEQLRALTASLSSAREEEGLRIAREIHDELGSLLTSLRWELERVDKILSNAGEQSSANTLHEKVVNMLKLTDTTISTVRRIAAEMRPSVLDDLGLPEAIEWQAQQFQARTGIQCHCDCWLENPPLTREQATALFRIFQEALTNILRHAEATRVEIMMEVRTGYFVLTVSDNGKGITEDEQAGIHSLGLLGMHERARLVNGVITITGTAGKGTVVTARVPITA